MPYLGRSPGSGVRTRFIYAATAGQTSFSGNDSNSVSLAYEDTLYMDVYQNGVLLKPVTDYAATTGTSVVLVTGATTDDVVEMIVYDTFAVADTVSAKDGGTFSGNVAMGGTLDVTGAITSSAGATITTADNNAQLVLKSTDADASVGPLLQLHRDSASPADDDAMGTIDFRGENSASEVINYVRINTRSADVTDGTEDAKFDVNTYVAGASVNRFSMTPTETVFNEDSVDVDFRVEGNGDANLLYVDAGNDRIGIGEASPDTQLHISSGAPNFRMEDTDTNRYANLSYGTRVLNIDNVMASSEVGTTVDPATAFRFTDTNGTTEVARFVPDNKSLCIGRTTSIFSSKLNVDSDNSSENPMAVISQHAGSSSQYLVLFYRGNDSDGYSLTGHIQNTNNATSYNTSSDYRLKENVDYTWDATTRLKQLKPARFNFISEADTTVDGFLAHEVSSIVPEAITGTKDATKTETYIVTPAVIDSDGNETRPAVKGSRTVPDYQAIDQSKLVPLLVKTIQELEARITALEAQMSKAAELAALIGSQTALSNRNIIINGAMQVAQRATSATGVGGDASYPTLDRFRQNTSHTAGRFTMSQVAVTDLPGFANALKLDCTTADTSIASNEIGLIMQRFEGQDLQQLKKGTSSAEPVTVSFYVKGNASATYTLELADSDNDRQISQTFSVTTSWNRVSLTFAGDTSGALDDDNASSIELNFWIHAGSNFNGGTLSTTWTSSTSANRASSSATSFFDSTDRELFITGLQMEIGEQATPFEHRSFGEELAACQRYYYQAGYDQNVGVDTTIFAGVAASATLAAQCYRKHPVEMRTPPTMALGGSVTAYDGDSNTSVGSIATNACSNTDGTANFNTTELGAGRAVMILLNDPADFISFDSEL